MSRRTGLSVVLALLLVAGPAAAAIGDGEETVLDRRVSYRPVASQQDAAHAPMAGEQACRDAVNAMSQMGHTLQQLRTEILPMMVEAGEQVVHEMEPTMERLAPTMQKLAERMREVAREMEQSLREPPGQPPRR